MRVFSALLFGCAVLFTPSMTKRSAVTDWQTNSIKVGDMAPELALESPDGKVIKLSSLRGNIVLIDFWASWCGPCRRENPNIVRSYMKYRNAKYKDAKGFEVYSVSLDNNRNAWTEAIRKDGLIWKSHVSDLKKWNCHAAQLYGVTAIPTNFLIDKNGVVIAKNLRGNMIDMELDKLIKSF